MAIRLESVSFTYMPGTPYERQALDDVSLEIADGSFTAIAGHTGSGKSTLVQHLNGLLHPLRGRVLVDGVDIASRAKADRAAVKKACQSVGMVFQYPEQQLFEETIAADIAFGPRNQELPEAEVEKRVDAAMHLVHLDPKLKDRSPFQLSGGQMRRVAIAGVLALRPKYLVLDEPTAGLDPRGREQLIAGIRELHDKHGVTILFISHNMDDVARLADTLIVMDGGRKVCEAAPREAFQQKEMLRHAGLREPEAMQLMQQICSKGLDVRTDAMTIDEAVRGILEARKARRAGKGGKGHA